jgi:hypothetical protein
MKKILILISCLISINSGQAQYSSPYGQNNSQSPYGQSSPPTFVYPQQNNQIQTLGEAPKGYVPSTTTSPFSYPQQQQPIQQPTVTCMPNGVGGFTCR